MIEHSEWIYSIINLWPRFIRIPSSIRTEAGIKNAKNLGFLEIPPTKEISGDCKGVDIDPEYWTILHYSLDCKNIVMNVDPESKFVSLADCLPKQAAYNDAPPQQIKVYETVFRCEKFALKELSNGEKQKNSTYYKCLEKLTLKGAENAFFECPLSMNCARLVQRCPLNEKCTYSRLTATFDCRVTVDNGYFVLECNAIVKSLSQLIEQAIEDSKKKNAAKTMEIKLMSGAKRLKWFL